MNLAGIAGGLGTGYFEGQDQAMRRQKLLYEMQQQRMQDEQAAKTRAGMGQGIEMLQPPPQQQRSAPQPPGPGQSSQPQPPRPQGLQLPPEFQVPGMQAGQQPPPQQGPRAQGAALPPWTSPKAPPAPPQGSPQSIQPPPQQGQQGQQGYQAPDLATVMQGLMKRGMDGETAFQVAQRLEPIMSMKGKMELQQALAMAREKKAEADELRANTGAKGEARRGETAAGTNAAGAAKVFQMTASGEAALMRAQKYKGGGSGGKGGWVPASDDVDAMAEAVAAGKVDPRSLSEKDRYRDRVIASALKKNPNYNMNDMMSNRAFATSQSRSAGAALGRVEFAIQDMQEIAPLITKASAKVPRSDFLPINQLINKFQQGVVQDPNQRELAIYINSMLNAYDQLAARGGTDRDKRAAVRGLLTTADSPQALNAGVKAFIEEALAAERAGNKTRDIVAPKGGGGAKADWSDADEKRLKELEAKHGAK